LSAGLPFTRAVPVVGRIHASFLRIYFKVHTTVVIRREEKDSRNPMEAGSGKRGAKGKKKKAKRKRRRAICLFPGASASSAPVVGDFNLPG